LQGEQEEAGGRHGEHEGAHGHHRLPGLEARHRRDGGNAVEDRVARLPFEADEVERVLGRVVARAVVLDERGVARDLVGVGAGARDRGEAGAEGGQ
jgi:hypothetical protein